MTADTYSSDAVGVLLMGTGNDNNTWGSNANTSVFQIIMDALTNALTSAVTGGTLDLSGTPPPAASSSARYAALIFTGVLTSNELVQIPNFAKFWWVKNATSGAFTLKFKTSAGSASTAIPQNSGWQLVQCDGSNAIVVSPFNSIQVQMGDGTVSAPAYSNLTEPTAGWYRAGTQDWRLSINGADVLQVTGTGASSPSIVNAMSPNVMQQAGVQIVPAGVEVPYAGITAPTGWYLEYGQAVTRSTDTALLAAITLTATGNTHTNTTLDTLSSDLRNLGLEGAYIEGTGISLGTTIVSVDSATSLTLSAAATGTASISIRVLPYGQGDGSTTFNIPDRRGRAIAGRDNMGGSAASRLTGLTNGILGTKLSGTGGEQSHTITAAEMASHTHTSPALTDPGHAHTLKYDQQTATAGSSTAFNYAHSPINGTSGTNTTTGGSATTGITLAATTGSTGSDTAHNNVQPTGISNMMIKR